MNLRYVSTPDIPELEIAAVKSVLSKAFEGLRTGRSIQPVQTFTEFADSTGDAIFYPGALLDLGVVGVKVSPYLASLLKAGKPPVTAVTLLISTETGKPILVCDSVSLTTARTAATTSLALDHLLDPSAERLLVVGSGKVAEEHLRYALSQHTWTEVSIFSPSLPSSDPDSVQRRLALTERFGELRFAAKADDAAKDADVILLCTSSATPVIHNITVLRAQVVTSISTNAARAHEVNPDVLSQVDVYCDYRATAPVTAGEMQIAQESHGWSPDAIVADLPELLTGATRRQDGRTAFFRSTGLGIEDLAIATLV